MKGNELPVSRAQNKRDPDPVMDKALTAMESFASLNAPEQIGTIGKTIEFAKELVQFSWQARKERRDQAKALQDTLLRSVNLIAVSAGALQELEQGTPQEQQLAKRMLQAALSYNAVVRKVVSQPETLFSKIKRFFAVSAWGIDKALLREIHLPNHLEGEGLAGGHKITSQKEDTTSKKIATLIQGNPFHPGLEEPCRLQEIDAFHLKALSLLREQEVVPLGSFQRCRQMLADAPLEASIGEITVQSAVITLKQTVWHFPGEGIELSGAFQRDIVTTHISIPIKESFRALPKVVQTGFPHPLQRAGFALSWALLPRHLARPGEMPQYEQLLHKRKEIASELLPEGALNRRAKALVGQRREAFSQQLLRRHKECMCAFVMGSAPPDAGMLAPIDRFFDALSEKTHSYDLAARACAEVQERVFERALDHVWATIHHKWLLHTLPDPLSPEYLEQLLSAEYAKMQRLMESPKKSEWDVVKTAYQKLLAEVLIQRGAPLICFRLSEDLGVAAPHALPEPSRKLFDYLMMSFHDFVQELEEGKELLLEETLSRDTAYFRQQGVSYAKETEELVAYYSSRKG